MSDNPDKVILMASAVSQVGLTDYSYSWKAVLQNGDVGLVKQAEGLMKDTTQLHYGMCRSQCFWSLTHTEVKCNSAIILSFTHLLFLL